MEKDPYLLLSEVRDKLLPLVEIENNICYDMISCTVSSPDCILCLVDRIVEQYNKK